MTKSVMTSAPCAILMAGTLACASRAEGPAVNSAVRARSPATTTAETPMPLTVETAMAVAKRLIIVDGHVDLPYRLENGRSAKGALTEDPSKRTKRGEMDLVRALEGGLDAPFMSIYVPARYQKAGGAKKLADRLIDLVEALAAAEPERWAVARSPDDIVANHTRGRVSLPLGIENGAALEDDLANVAHFARRGVGYITLTHSKDNLICDSSYDDRHTWKGLSPYGRKVVKRMNEAGIMIDVSHVSDEAFEQVLAITKVPVIASHSSCRHFTPGFERNMSDAMIRKLAQNGGVIMINFGSSFLNDESRQDWEAKKEAMERHRKARGWALGSKAFTTYRAQYLRKNPRIYASVEDVADHIDHVVQVAGIDHVGLGSDFDGVGDSLPTGLKDVSQYPNLIRVLIARGYSEAELAKVAGGNLLRVWRTVQAYASPTRGP